MLNFLRSVTLIFETRCFAWHNRGKWPGTERVKNLIEIVQKIQTSRQNTLMFIKDRGTQETEESVKTIIFTD